MSGRSGHTPHRAGPDPDQTWPGLIRVSVELDLDARSGAELDTVLRGAAVDPGSPSEVAVDVGGLAVCDSTGLNILLRARGAAVAHGRTLRLKGSNLQLLGLLSRTGALPWPRGTPRSPSA
ncbi:hypothetical protein GCM10010371_69060 [Streptomyces subrutilus]|uniref:Anti-sigma factor antagonist n=1 Tax=Streptomyces subrutilus TaxID=36818 RepID=A0A5P2UE00_9ACTN|nr:anti-sigma factor antagonist [Streptomyces subrutilus]GGZ99947.1 hypothetical protein GCM10010371_69060 [Streptomyces subrutilus]